MKEKLKEAQSSSYNEAVEAADKAMAELDAKNEVRQKELSTVEGLNNFVNKEFAIKDAIRFLKPTDPKYLDALRALPPDDVNRIRLEVMNEDKRREREIDRKLKDFKP